MPCHVSSSAGRDAFADSEVHLLAYGTVFHLLCVVKTNFNIYSLFRVGHQSHPV